MDKNSEIHMIARGTLERDLDIYHKVREQKDAWYGIFSSLAREHHVSRERIRQIYRRLQQLMEVENE